MPANRLHEPWTREQTDTLIECYQAGMRWREIAERVGRPRESCRMKARYLTLTHGRPRDWNRRTDIIEDVADLLIFDYGRNQMARELGVSTKAIDNAIKQQNPGLVKGWKKRRNAPWQPQHSNTVSE